MLTFKILVLTLGIHIYYKYLLCYSHSYSVTILWHSKLKLYYFGGKIKYLYVIFQLSGRFLCLIVLVSIIYHQACQLRHRDIRRTSVSKVQFIKITAGSEKSTLTILVVSQMKWVRKGCSLDFDIWAWLRETFQGGV